MGRLLSLNAAAEKRKKKISLQYDQERFSARLKDPFSLSIFFWSCRMA
jgi:hypothetical protein